MIYKILPHQDKWLEENYEKVMAEFNEFYELNWQHHRPSIFIVNSRQMINDIWRQDTPDWVINWQNGGNIYMLDDETIEKESSHKKDSGPEKKIFHLRHELSHAFFFVKAGHCHKGPKWLWEGTAIYTAGQLKFTKPIEKFERFLNSTNQVEDGCYQESGFAVSALVKKFGKEKLLMLIKQLKDCLTNDIFNQKFKEVYGFEPTYEDFNNLEKQKK